MSDYTPTTEDVRAFYIAGTPPHRVSVAQGKAEFDQWLQSVKAEARAEGTREAAAYIDRLFPKGLVHKAGVLADLEIAADRQARHLHAIGRERADRIEKGQA